MRLLGSNISSTISLKMVTDYVNNFIQTAETDVNKAYELLDEEYKAKKFGTLDNFKRYISNNIENIHNAAPRSYGGNKKADYTEYYYMDTDKNMFIIRKEENKEGYTILLDEYTVKGDDYIKGYEKYTEEQKIYNNIFIFFRMINEKEYNSAYNLLDETFRANNFDTVDKFQEYAKNNFWNNNILTITKIQKQGDIYTGLFKIASGVGVSAAEKSKTFAIQLIDNAEFVMSFGV